MRKNRLMTVLLIMLFAGILASMFILRYAGNVALASPSENDWPMFHHDPAHTGYSNSTAPDTNNTIWTYATSGPIWSAPAVTDGEVYIGSYDYNIYCLNASSGAKIWNYSTGGSVDSSPAVSDGKIYIGWGSAVLCLDASTGTPLWNYSTSGGVYSSPAVSDGRVYVGSLDHNLYCLNASDGTNIWTSQTTGFVLSSPAVADDRVFIGSCFSPDSDANMTCFNASTGSAIWTRQIALTAYIWSSPAVAGGKVYIGGDQVFCLDASNGTAIWSYAVPSVSSPAVYGGRVYVGTSDNNTCCFDASNGTRIWNYTTAFASRSAPAVADGKVYIGSDQIHCLDALNGTKIWSYSTNGNTGSSPAVAYGRVYIGSSDNNVYAFEDVHNLTITASYGGTTEPEPGTYAYVENTMVGVTATPSIGYNLDHWELDGFTTYLNPINVTMDRDHALMAVFNHNVTIEAFCITENVTLNLDITMDNLPTNYTTPYTFVLVGTHNFTVPETDPNGHYFEQWSTGETNNTITVGSPPVLTAKYKVKWQLTIDEASGGTTDPSQKKQKYFDGTIVNVMALPSLGYLLDHWLLDTYNAGSSNPISITMDADHTLQPVFSWVGICNLIVTATTGGTTTPSPGTYEYTNGTIVDVIALIDEGYGLHHWELDEVEVGSPNPITVTMDANHTLNAVFKAVYELTITATSGGTTDPPPGIHSYWEGSSVTVTATEYAGFAFDHWMLDGSPEYSNPINVEMNADRALNAIFVYNVTISAKCNIEGEVSVDITMDGSPTGFKTPHKFTGLTGTHTFTVPGTDPNGHPFLSWIWGTSWSTNIQLSVNKNGTYQAVYYFQVPPPRVGGTYYSADVTLLLAPHIVLTVILFALTVITGARVKHLRRREQ
jgi:outer membrane protein assembly factor BamB